eukprot:TRINITY_DN1853_c0_g1_i1.p11 TRINITY_DN1853_c0_g1~~TRINITY_DN1853_c0_g1_i1.p11  ORF type:complete len:135 (-),score=17.65 TRINITY_DN1853_c0_g1_i1:4804-5208(-)
MIRISERGVKTLKRILEMSKPQTSLRILQAFAGLRFVDLFKPSKARKDRRGEVPRRPKRSEEVLKSPLGDLAKQLIEGGSAGVLAFFFLSFPWPSPPEPSWLSHERDSFLGGKPPAGACLTFEEIKRSKSCCLI